MSYITVFTPTYNRAYIIETLYHSLQRQTFTDFEWLVVDDGSIDNTAELFSKWKAENNPFFIRYYKKSNGGKCRAINHALDLAKGELFFTVDSDDYLTDDALEKVVQWFDQIGGHTGFAGVVANRGYSATETTNNIFPEKSRDLSLLEMEVDRNKNCCFYNGERAFIFYTDVHRKYKYPEFNGENFMTEAVAWNRMANDGYKMRFYNDIIWIFEYKDDGLTKSGNSVFLKNPYGYGLWLKERADFAHCNFRYRLKMYYTFTCDLYELYDSEIIAECIGAPKGLIKVICAFRILRAYIYQIIKNMGEM